MAITERFIYRCAYPRSAKMPNIDLIIRTEGRGRNSIDDAVRRAFGNHDFYPRGSYAFETPNEEALATLWHLRGMPKSNLDGIAQEALPGANYAVLVSRKPEYAFRVVDAVNIGAEIAEGYLAGKEGRLHRAGRWAAELWDKVSSEGWAPSAPIVEFAVVVPSSDDDARNMVVYSAKCGLTGGKFAFYNENSHPREIA